MAMRQDVESDSGTVCGHVCGAEVDAANAPQLGESPFPAEC